MADVEKMTKEVREKVRSYLNEIYPDFVEFDDGYFTVQEGSATVAITVRPWHDEDTAVEFSSQLSSGGNITQDVMKWLLQKNVALHFGALGLMFDNSVVYSHTLPGDSMSKESFEATVRTVATIADHYDDEIVAMAGGRLGSQNAEAIANEAAATT